MADPNDPIHDESRRPKPYPSPIGRNRPSSSSDPNHDQAQNEAQSSGTRAWMSGPSPILPENFFQQHLVAAPANPPVQVEDENQAPAPNPPIQEEDANQFQPEQQPPVDDLSGNQIQTGDSHQVGGCYKAVLAAPVVLRRSYASVVPNQTITKVSQLLDKSFGVTMMVKVVNRKIVLNNGRRGGPRANMQAAECLVGDETGAIVFKAVNKQVDLMKRGVTVTLRNARMVKFKGSRKLVVDSGRVEVSSPASFTVNEYNNLSLLVLDQ